MNYGSTSSCGQCPANSYCPAGASAATACSTLASGFYPNSAAGSDAASDCKTNSLSGKYVKTANDSSATTCSCGTYKGAHQVNYGSTSSCVTTSAGYYAAEGAASQTQASAGYYAAAGACSQTKVTAGCYTTAKGSSVACPNSCADLGGGLYKNSTSGSDAATDCYVTTTAGKYIKATTDTAQTTCPSGDYCPSTTLYWDNAGGNIDCPGSYTAGGTGLTKQAECKISVAGGKYVGSANSSTLSTCECGTYKAQHTVAYGSTSSCVTTSAGYYAAEGAASQTQASAGYYAAAGACSQTAIQAGCFGSAGSAVACPNSCPAAESGWTLASTTGLKVVTDCAEITTPSTSGSPIATICTAGTLTKKATSATAWGNPTASGLTAKAGRYVDGTTCSACAKGTYTSSATTATSCTPAAKGYYVSGTEATSQTACAAGTYTSSTGQSVCSNAAAGTYTTGCQDTTNNKACTGTAVCAQNNYSDAKASKCTACATANGYGNSGSTAASHAGVASCKVTCGAGTYVATAGAGCVNVSTGYWGAGGTVAQNATLTRMACASGLTTIGYGTGANEAADCGRKLHAGDNVIYLRSEARTSPALNVKVGDTKFYGALSTSLSGALKVKKDSTEYSVVNDWQ